MLWLHEVFMKTACSISTHRRITRRFFSHAPLHFFRSLNRPRKEFEEPTICSFSKLSFADSSFKVSLKISIRAKKILTSQPATAASESQNHPTLMVFFASAPRLRTSRWVMVHRSRSPGDDEESLWNRTITGNSSNNDNDTDNDDKDYDDHHHHNSNSNNNNNNNTMTTTTTTTTSTITTQKHVNKQLHTATTESKQRHEPTTSSTMTAVWFFLLFRYARHVITAYYSSWCHHLGTRANCTHTCHTYMFKSLLLVCQMYLRTKVVTVWFTPYTVQKLYSSVPPCSNTIRKDTFSS